VSLSRTCPSSPRRCRDQRGEGVISAAIAVLIVAFLGALMWVGFQQIWANAEAQTTEQINQIGG
jgi:TRAP-type C4-dicarboxylate transport system permease small subunit